jgi:type IV pilus assembly protein PilC
MTPFKYSARDQSGKVVNGVMEAKTREGVIGTLQNKGLIVVKVEENLGFNIQAINEINIGGVPMKDKVVFLRQLSTMVSAGLPLTQALDILETQATNPLFKKVMSDVLLDVQGGVSLAEAFRKAEGVFDDITLNLIQAGEESGNLELILERLAIEVEEQKKLSDKLRGALIYPVIIISVVVGVIVLLMFVLVPAMEDIYSEFGADLPGITKAMIAGSNFLLSYWWVILIALSILGVLLKSYTDTPNGKRALHKVLLKVPVFGMIVQKTQLAQFTRVLSLLLKSGLSIVKALELTSGSMSNVLFKEDIMTARKEVEKGVALAIPLARSQRFPLIISQMIAVGEESGEIDSVLEKMSEYYNDEVAVTTENITTLLEPLMLLLMGGVIAFIALAVYMPMFNLSTVIQ